MKEEPAWLVEGSIIAATLNQKRVCPNCGEKMVQQFIGLTHCKCGISWHKDMGYFERTAGMIFALERQRVGKKLKQFPVIRNIGDC